MISLRSCYDAFASFLAAPRRTRRPTPRPAQRPAAAHRGGGPRPAATGRLDRHSNFSPLRGRRVLALLDFENVAFSLQNIHGARFSPAGLLRAMRAAASSVEPLAVLTSDRARHAYRRSLEAAGFRVIELPRETVTTCRGRELRANSDPTLLFEAGFLAAQAKRGDTICIISGDGELGSVCAQGFRRHLGRAVRLLAAGVPLSISGQLRCRNGLFDAAPISLGQDCIEAASLAV